MEQSSHSGHHSNEACQCDSQVSILDRYLNHLFESIKRDSDEIYLICQQTGDASSAKRLRRFYQGYVRDLSSLVQYLNINDEISPEVHGVENCKYDRAVESVRYFPSVGKSVDRLSENRESPLREYSKIPTPRNSSVGHNVDAPCFIPHRLNGDEIGDPSLEDLDSAHGMELSDGLPHFNTNMWHLPALLHSQYPLPHYHMACASNFPYSGSNSMANYSSVLLPSLQGNGISFPLQYPQYAHYPPGLIPPHHYATVDGEGSDLPETRKRQKSRFHGHFRSKVFGLQSDRAKFNVPAAATAAAADLKQEETHDQSSVNHKSDAPHDEVTDLEIADKSPSGSNACAESIDFKTNQLNEERKLEIKMDASKTDIPKSHIRDAPKMCPVNQERSPVNDPSEEAFLSQDRLRDFPELAAHISGPKCPRKPRCRLPRVKYQKKPKFSISDLYKTFNAPIMDGPSQSRSNNNLLSASSGSTGGRDRKLKTNMYHKSKCCCSNQINLFAHYSALYEEVQEDASEEADGWKKVKPRYRNKDPVHLCKVCQPNYSRPFNSSHRNKPLNIKRNSHFGRERYKVHSNNCVRGAIPPQVLDLHYNNMFAPARMVPKQRKVNNGIKHSLEMASRSIGRFIEVSGSVSSNQSINEVGCSPSTVLPDSSKLMAASFKSESSKDAQDPGTGGDSPGTSLMWSPPPDEEATVSNPSTSLAKAVSYCSLPDDDSNADTHNLSIEDDSQISDVIPVVGDAQDMHEDFMQYLNCSTWPTQMDEIDKFESMVADNNPKDPVLMYPSVSVEQFEEFIHRHPTEAQAFRRKITSKLKKIKETENKQQQAYEKRLQLLQCKTEKVRGFVQKVKDVQIAQDKLALKRKHQIDEKLRKAEENRKNYLSSIRRKAHDEEEKLKEIAFINELEAQNRRHDSLALRQEHEERLQCIIDERQRKVEEKAAKEAAVEERRRVLEAERQQKLLKIAEARRKKEETIDRKQQERENQRLVTAREKAREREERLLALNAAQRATAEELQKRIQQKQEDSARRHEENIESIRQRALEVGLHRNPDDADELCNLESEQTIDGSKEKLKALKKKRCRKLRSRMTARASEFLEEYAAPIDGDNQGRMSHEFPFSGPLKDLQSMSDQVDLVEMIKHISSLKEILSKGATTIYEDFSKNRGFICLGDLMKEFLNKPHYSLNTQHILLFTSIIDIYHDFLRKGDNWKYFVMSNDVMFIVDCLRFSVMGLKSTVPSWSRISGRLIELLTHTLLRISQIDDTTNGEFLLISCRMTDVVSYIINSGLVEKIICLFQDGVIDDNCHHMSMIPSCVKFFTLMISPRYKGAELMNTLVSTDCFGTIPLLYEGLQKMAGSEQQPVYIVPIIELLLKFAELDVLLFQDTLGDDGMALQVRAIASNLMNYCKGKPLDELLRAVILLVGYFAMKNVKNQTLLQSGHQPTVLQQLVTLPFIYFCDVGHTDYLFPTLFVCSYNNPTNRAIVENELSFCHLEDYVNSERGKKNRMIQLFYKLNVRT